VSHLWKPFLFIAVAAFAAGTTFAARQEVSQPLAGKVEADQRIQRLVLSPRNSTGEASGDPLFVKVDADGGFRDPRIQPGLYFVSTQPPCVKITALTLNGNSLLSLATRNPSTEKQVDPGVTASASTQSRTPFLAFFLGERTVQTKTTELTFQNSTAADLQLGAFRIRALNAGGSASAKFSVGGIRMVSNLCRSELLKDDANTIRVTGDPALSKPE
jgi:hypothetical protein